MVALLRSFLTGKRHMGGLGRCVPSASRSALPFWCEACDFPTIHTWRQWLSGSMYRPASPHLPSRLSQPHADSPADGTRALRPGRASSLALASWHTQAPACSCPTGSRRRWASCPPRKTRRISRRLYRKLLLSTGQIDNASSESAWHSMQTCMSDMGSTMVQLGVRIVTLGCPSDPSITTQYSFIGLSRVLSSMPSRLRSRTIRKRSVYIQIRPSHLAIQLHQSNHAENDDK